MSSGESKSSEGSRKPPQPPLSRSSRSGDITIKIRDSLSVDTLLKMHRSVKLQKAFDVYAQKKGLDVRFLRFLMDGEVIDGECSPDSLDMAENEVIEVKRDGYDQLFQSEAPYVIRIVYKEATIRNGVDLDDTQEVRKMQLGETVEAFHRAETKEGIGRYLINEGWISERLRTPNEEKVTLVLRELASAPWKYIVGASGAKVREGLGFDTRELTHIPAATEIEVVEMRLLENPSASPAASPGSAPSGSESQAPVRRLRIVRPEQYAGWITDKPVTVNRVAEPQKKVDAELGRELARRAQVRMGRLLAAREELKRKASQPDPKRPRCIASGSLDVSSDCLFLINGAQKAHGVAVSSDFKTVTASSTCQSRSMALGSRGFSRGTHYWEVQLESMGQPGNIFIGVAPADYVQSWGGYGFVNYRTKISLTTDETMYGRWTKPGDTLGVLLDMDHGTLSFFLDTPEDMLSTNNMGKVWNMGVSHHYLRRVGHGGSRFPVLYPCFGIKHQGDQVSIRKCKWVSRRGLDAPALFGQLMEAKSIVSHWRNSYALPSPSALALAPPASFVETMYAGYQRSRTLLRQVTSRPGVQVLLNTHAEAVAQACGAELAARFRLRALKRFTSPRYGPGHIVGARGRQLWFVLESTDSDETGAWYWQRGELEELISSGLVSFDNPSSAAGAAAAAGATGAVGEDPAGLLVAGARRGGGQASPRSPTSPPPTPMSLSEFAACAFPAFASASGLLVSAGRPWTLDEDVALCSALNAFADKEGEDPSRLSSDQLETFRSRLTVLQGRERAEIHARYAALCVLNRAVELALPLSDLGVHQAGGSLSNLVTVTDYELGLQRRLRLPVPSGPSQALLDIKKVVFFRTKQRFWDLVVKKTTAPTAEPSDEWDKPSDLREIQLNRLVARSLVSHKESHPFAERLRRSVFGQLMEALGGWDDSLLRRAYQHYPDAGQARAFFVKFEGEGSDDLGGPYRAVFNTVIGEECPDLLDLLLPCPNSESGVFENRDKTLLNPRLVASGWGNGSGSGSGSGSGAGAGSGSGSGSGSGAGSGGSGGAITPSNVYVSLGKLIGVACRHAIPVPLSLPALVWKPLLGEALEHADLRAVDTHTSNFLLGLGMPVRGAGAAGAADAAGGGGGGGGGGVSPRQAGGAGDGEPLDAASAQLLRDMLLQLHESLPAVTPRVADRLLALCTVDASAPPDAAATAAAAANTRRVCALVEHLHLVRQNDCVAQLFRGLDAVLPTEVFRIFSPGELEQVFCGAADLDLDVLRNVTVYDGVAPFDRHVQFFWQALEQLSQDERSKFVNFCSGRSRLPSSASAYTMPFKLGKPPHQSEADPDAYLPKASTCFFTLNLPNYSSAQVSASLRLLLPAPAISPPSLIAPPHPPPFSPPSPPPRRFVSTS